MTAYEEMVGGLLQRLAAVESNVEALVRCRAEDVSEGGVLFNHGTQLGLLSDNLQALEQAIEQAKEEDADRRAHSERERRADWKRTYNAAIPEAMRVCGNYTTPDVYATRVHEHCKLIADRAHGPLEGKAIDVDRRLNELADEAVFKRSEVSALIEVAKEAHHYQNRLPTDCVYRIRAALQPFLQESGGQR